MFSMCSSFDTAMLWKLIRNSLSEDWTTSEMGRYPIYFGAAVHQGHLAGIITRKDCSTILILLRRHWFSIKLCCGQQYFAFPARDRSFFEDNVLALILLINHLKKRKPADFWIRVSSLSEVYNVIFISFPKYKPFVAILSWMSSLLWFKWSERKNKNKGKLEYKFFPSWRCAWLATINTENEQGIYLEDVYLQWTDF